MAVAVEKGIQPRLVAEDTRQRRAVLLAITPDALRGQVQRFLARLGFRVLEAPAPDRALTALERVSLDLVITEDRNGYGFVREVLAKRPGLRILVISTEPEEINGALICEPAVAFLEKPFAWGELRRRLEGFLPALPPESRAKYLCA